MSIESEILRIQHNVADTYAAVAGKGGTVPTQPTSANLAAAVASIPAGTGDTTLLVRAPVGAIVIWSGTADNIPTGWQLCDGTNGTPDLRDKFVLGAGTAHSVGETGGSEEVTLTEAQIPSHQHTIIAYSSGTTNAGTNRAIATTKVAQQMNVSSQAAGSSHPHPNMPPYYALCYIMKLTADATDGVTQEELTEALEGKQDALTGTEGQVVGFDADGNAVAQEAPSGGEVYSTEERVIGTWIDGKPLYRKCFQTTSPTIQDYTTVLVPFPDIVPIHIYGNLIVSDPAGSIMPLNFLEGSSSYIFTWYIYNAIQMKQAHPENVFSEKPVNIVCEYTKTTDTAST